MHEVFKVVLSLSLSGALLAGLTFLLTALFGRRLSQTWRYYVWLLVLLRLVVPLALPQLNLVGQAFFPKEVRPAIFQDTPGQEQEDASVLQAQGPLGEAPDGAGGTQPASPVSEGGTGVKAAPVDWDGLWRQLYENLWIAWLGIAMMLLMRKVTSYHGFTRFIRAGWQPVDDPQVLDALEEARQAVGLSRAPGLYLNPLASSPMLVGLLRPVIVLPDTRLPEGALKHVLMHELIHHRRKDIFYKWFVQAILCLHWFNPVLYLMRRRINLACELSCDEQVLRRTQQEDRRQYGDTLLSSVEISGRYGDAVASVTMSEEGKMMKKRLQAIAGYRGKSIAALALSVFLTVILLGGASVAGAYTGQGTESASAGQNDAPPVPTAQPNDVPPVATPKPTQPSGGSDDDWLGLGWLADMGDWDWLDWNDVDWEDEGFSNSTSYIDGRAIIKKTHYSGGYLLALTYDSRYEAREGDTALTVPQRVILPEEVQGHLAEPGFEAALGEAVAAFLKQNDRVTLRGDSLRLSAVDGPYEETPDELLAHFYQSGEIAKYAALVRHAGPDALQEMLVRTVSDGQVAYTAITVDLSRPTPAQADGLLSTAYENRETANFYILVEYGSDAGRQELLSRAISDGRVELIAGLMDEGDVDIGLLMDALKSNLSPGILAQLADELTEEQAHELAEAAYVDNDIAVFTLVVDELSDAVRRAYYDRAREDGRAAFQAIAGD